MASTPPGPYSRALVSPRLNEEYLNSRIIREDYHHFPGTRVTVCCLTVKNDHAVIGVAICAENSRFAPQAGRQKARQKALVALMDYEQYLLRQRLYEHRTGQHYDN